MKTNLFRSMHIAIAIAMCVASMTVQARKIKTKHSIPKTSAKAQENGTHGDLDILSMDSDSIDFCQRIESAISFYGFDKTVGSNQESFFITNRLDFAIRGIEIEITYKDMKGRQLHKRKVKIECDIPAGETKRTDIKSWDTQKSFYFHQSAKPRRQATPFDVKFRLISVTHSSEAKR